MRLNKKSSQGFTLIEILVAIAVLAIALTAVNYSLQQAANHLNYLRDKNNAYRQAETLLSKINAGIEPMPMMDSLHTGVIHDVEKDWPWTIRLQNTAIDHVVSVRVDIQSPDKKINLATLEDYFYQDDKGTVVLWR